jgi:hypothetical protein
MTIRFDDAWTQALDVARQAAAATRMDVVLIRDVLGRVSLVVDDSEGGRLADGLADEMGGRLAEETGAFTAPARVTLASELFVPESVFRARDLVVVQDASETAGQVSILERGVVGAEWLHPKPDSADAPVRRVALYGFKGGVGRSIAAFMLAQHLANQGGGRCVLAVDLDLESPGLGALLQADDELPDYGLVDYFAESAVGNQEGLDLVVKSSLVQVGGNGEVWVAPAGGRPREGYSYLAKLNRVYAELPRDDEAGGAATGPSGLAWRLEAAISACDEQVSRLSRRPDVVLLDSRAGIHDIAAIAITQLADLSLLFGTDNAPTWNGYRALFQQWGQSAERAQSIRERLRMVAAMVPRERREAYLEDFRDHAQACFADTLYDNVPGDIALEGGADIFNFTPDDEDAPHSPLPILFVPQFVGMNFASQSDWHKIDPDAYAMFLEGAADLIFGDGS